MGESERLTVMEMGERMREREGSMKSERDMTREVDNFSALGI